VRRGAGDLADVAERKKMTTQYTLHYAADTFKLDVEEAAGVREALQHAKNGSPVVVTIEYLNSDGGSERHELLVAPGVPVYLSESHSPPQGTGQRGPASE
jgi:hypothetical protein